MLTIRPAELDDAAAIASVHVNAWQAAYKGIIPQHYLDAMTVQNRHDGWLQVLERDTSIAFTLISEDHDQHIVGYASAGLARSYKRFFQAEISSLYVLPDYQDAQHGRRLFMAAANRLAGGGFKGLIVWVLAENPARKFYQKLGGKLVGQTTRPFAGTLLREVCYGWEETPSYGD